MRYTLPAEVLANVSAFTCSVFRHVLLHGKPDQCIPFGGSLSIFFLCLQRCISCESYLPKDNSLMGWAKLQLPSFSRDAAYLHFNIHLKCNPFFWICLDTCIRFTPMQLLVCTVAKRKTVSLLLHYLFWRCSSDVCPV